MRPGPALCRWLGRCGALAGWWLVVATACAAGAGDQALLIGVSDYPTLPADKQLKGPRNDVPLLRDALIERGMPPAAIRLLADGVAGAALPTRDNILTALDGIAGSVQAGDQVVLYFAGHGSQQPVDPQSPYAADEPDGLFETFLPRDVGRWQQPPARRAGVVHNAILDHEIRSRVDRIGVQGAFVWAIFDTCRSAALVRGAADAAGVTLSGVAPALLGVPAAVPGWSAVPGPHDTARPRPAVPPTAVYFYAAQSTEGTPELRLPTRQPDAQVHGLFTYALLQSLAGGAGMSYRQLAQAVLLRYGAIGEGSAITPQFSGSGLDTPVLGRAAPPVRQWRLRAPPEPTDAASPLVLAAGELSDLRPGAVLAVLPAPASATAAALGFVRVQQATAHTAQLVPVAYAGLGAAPLVLLRTGAVARLVLPAPRTGLAVQADLAACAQPCRFAPALDKLRTASPQPPAARLTWLADGEPADLRLVAVDDRLWLLSPAAPGRPCSNGMPAQRSACAWALSRSNPAISATATATADQLAGIIEADLAAAARALDLLRPASQSPPDPGVLQTEITLQSQGGATRPYLDGTVPALRSGDAVRLTLRNAGAVAVDVTVLHVDARYGIQAVYPPAGAMNRFVAGATAQLVLGLDGRMTSGLERLVIIASATGTHQERADFSALSQPALRADEVVRGQAGLWDDSTRLRVVSWQLMQLP